MTTKKPTHTGEIIGTDARVRADFRARVNLRELKLHWVTDSGRKFDKRTGRGLGSWPTYSLDLATIRPLPKDSTNAA